MNEQTYEVSLESIIDNFEMELNIGIGSKKNMYEVQHYEHEKNIEVRRSILDLRVINPTPRHIKKILSDALGVTVKVKKITYGKWVQFYVDTTPIMKNMSWGALLLHIPLPNGMELTGFRLNFRRKY